MMVNKAMSQVTADHNGRTVSGMNCLASSNTGIVGSNATRGMDACVRVFYVRAVLSAGLCLADPHPRSPTNCEKDRKTVKAAKVQ
jgi:hypothetical protein